MQEILFGWHVLEEILKNNSRKIKEIHVLKQNLNKLEEMLNYYKKENIIKIRTKEELNKINFNHQGICIYTFVLKELSLKEWLLKINLNEKNLLIACDCIQDERNLGAIIRSARAFNCSGILITKNNSANINAIVAKASAGATESLPIISASNLATSLDELKKNGFFVYALDHNGEQNWKIAKLSVLVLGQEGKGLRELTKKKCDKIIKIQTNENFQVLNVSVAASIAIYKILKE